MNDPKRIDPRVFDLYDEYCHGHITRREFLSRTAAMTIGGVSALWMAQALLPRYVEAQTISFTDSRMKGTYVGYPSPGGTSGTMRGYLVAPSGDGPFLALAPDGLSPVGGYPGNDDDGRTLQRSLEPEQLDQDMINSARFLKGHELSTGRLGATGFCWGGGMTNRLAVELGADLDAGVPFYGASAASEDVSKMNASLLIIYADTDPRINAMWPDYETALQANGVNHQMEKFPGTLHGFHNNSTPRYNEVAANQAWNRTVGFFREHLAG